MKTTFRLFQILLLMCGVFGEDKVKTVSLSATEGESFTLNPDPTMMQDFFQIVWKFGENDQRIAQIDRNKTSYDEEKIFQNRLQLNPTGSLTIKNIRTKHSSLYKAEIDNSGGLSKMIFLVTVYESPSVIDASIAETKTVSLNEGDSGTLQTDITELTGDELIVWRFGDEGKLISKSDIEAKSPPLYDTDGRFRDRLQLNDQTGSLTINNMKNTDSGFYTVKISSNKQMINKKFIVTVSVITGKGLSSGAVAGIVVGFLLAFAAAAAMGFVYYRRKISELRNESVTVTVGYSVTLYTDLREIQANSQILWYCGDYDHPIAKIKGGTGETPTYDDGPAGIFRNKLKLDKRTGDLTIKNTIIEHGGLYRLQISTDNGITSKRFRVTVEEKPVPVTVGDPVTLKTDLREIQKNSQILWYCEDYDHPIAKIKGGAGESPTYDDGPGGIFKDKLKLNKKTGDLTITNTTDEHDKLYKLQISTDSGITSKRFRVTIEEKPVPVTVGYSVTLYTDLGEIQENNQILWYCEDYDHPIAKIKGGTGETPTYDDGPGGIFRNKLKLDKKTGDLTITNTIIEHDNLYELQISTDSGITSKRFRVTVEAKPVTVIEGYSVTLNTDLREIQENNQILWYCGDYDHPIAEIKAGTGETPTYDDGPGGIFRNKLKLNKETGDLTITDTTDEHGGLYKLQIRTDNGITSKRFRVNVKAKPVTVTVGYSVTLNTDLPEIQENNQILWYCEDHDLPIAKIKGGTGETPTYDDGPGGRFENKLKLNKETGDLTITNTIIEHGGLYKLQISTDNGITSKRFRVNVKAKPVTVTVGYSFTLNTDLREIQANSQILWYCGDYDLPIAKIKAGTGESPTYDDGPGGIFRNKLKLNKETGDLTITDTTHEHGGLYKLQISTDNGITSRRFWVTVVEKTVPVIEGKSSTLNTGLTEIQISTDKGATSKRFNVFAEKNQVNESVTVNMPLLEYPDGANDQEAMSSL